VKILGSEPYSVPCRQGAAKRVAARGPLVFFVRKEVAGSERTEESRSARADAFEKGTLMVRFLAVTQAGCRRSFARHLSHRITILAIAPFAVLIAQVIYPQPVGAKSGDRPNIVFILADNLGWRDLSGAGSSFYESPHIDRIAAEGMRFTQGYAACQVCSPSRASIMTGKYPTRHGSRRNKALVSQLLRSRCGCAVFSSPPDVHRRDGTTHRGMQWSVSQQARMRRENYQ
jgi:hypothetical protein